MRPPICRNPLCRDFGVDVIPDFELSSASASPRPLRQLQTTIANWLATAATIAIGLGLALLLNTTWYIVLLPFGAIVIYSRWRGIDGTIFDAVILTLCLGILALGIIGFLSWN